jgi:hypothetical protein
MSDRPLTEAERVILQRALQIVSSGGDGQHQQLQLQQRRGEDRTGDQGGPSRRTAVAIPATPRTTGASKFKKK